MIISHDQGRASVSLQKPRASSQAPANNSSVNFSGWFITESELTINCDAAGIVWPRSKIGRAKAAAVISVALRRSLKPNNMPDDNESIPIPDGWWREFSTPQVQFLQSEVFECTNPQNEKGVSTMSWRLKPAIRARIFNMRKSQPKSGRMIDVATGEAISLSEMSKAGRKLPNVAGSVKVSQEALSIGCYALNDWLNYFQNGMQGAEPLVFRDEMKANKRLAHNDKAAVIKAMTEYCQRSQYAMQNILDRAQQNRKGMLTQSYRKADSGRQFIIGESLQSCTKLACMTALHGHYEYDFESCHQSLALELSKQWSECPSLETLEYVVNNKAAVRAELSNLTGQPISAVKSALIAPFFGATHTTWHKGAYIQTLTEQGYRQILKSELFQQYERDVQLFQFHLLDTCKRDSKMRAVNALGLVAPVGAGVKNEVAHLMQGYEVKAMKAATAATTSAVLWKHDAIVCAQPEDVESMTQAVKKATGLTLQMSQQQYRLSGLPEV